MKSRRKAREKISRRGWKRNVGKIFFFQAEDGIRDDLVTGVQTCALPIWGVEIKLKMFQSSKPSMRLYKSAVEHIYLRQLELELSPVMSRLQITSHTCTFAN